jgi:AGZA family xanthine/uracil permease-like MFS transporter
MQIVDRNLTLAKDLRGGLVAFLGSAYIAVLIPALLRSGADSAPITAVAGTALACAVGCVLFGLVTRLPFAVGPGSVEDSMYIIQSSHPQAIVQVPLRETANV